MLRYILMLVMFLTLHTFACADPLAGQFKDIPLDKAIKIGSGPRVVIEFSDPDCFFSRRMVIYWNLRRDVTRYVFLVAMKNHPDAPQKARYILTAADPVAAYGEVFAGRIDFDEKRLEYHYDDHGLFELHRQVANRVPIKSTPTYIIDGTVIEGTRLADIERILGGEQIPFVVGEPK